MLSLIVAVALTSVDSLPPYHTREHFGEFWYRVWHTEARNQTDTIFDQEGNGFWQKGDTIVYHWWPSGQPIPNGPIIKGKVEYSYDGRNHDTPKQ